MVIDTKKLHHEPFCPLLMVYISIMRKYIMNKLLSTPPDIASNIEARKQSRIKETNQRSFFLETIKISIKLVTEEINSISAI